MSPSVKAHCPKCDGERMCDLHGSVDKTWEWSDQHHSMYGGVKHSLLECRGCETVFSETTSWDSEDVDYSYDSDGKTVMEAVLTKSTHPKPDGRTKPVWLAAIHQIDSNLHGILNETYDAYDNQSYILTAIGLRTVLDLATGITGVDTNLTFREKFQALETGGYIGSTEREILSMVADAGSAAVHRGWTPEASQMKSVLEVTESFLHRVLVVAKEPLNIRDVIPQRPNRRNPV